MKNAAPPAAKLSIWEKLGYGTGDLASNLFFQVQIIFLQVYYTDTALLDPAKVAIIFGVVRLVDAITDPLMGGIADRTHTRWGQYRPWLLWLAVPFGAAYFLAFSVGNFEGPAKFWMAFGTYFLMLLIYTAINIPYGALCTSLTADPTERMSVRAWQFVMTQFGNLIVASTVLTMVAKLGQGDDVKGYQLTIGIYSAIAVVLFLICFFSTRERISSTGEPITDDYDAAKAAAERRTVSILQDLKALFRNDQWALLALGTFLILIGVVMRSSNTVYFAQYWLGDVAAATPYLILGGISAIGGSMVGGHYSGGVSARHFAITAMLVVLGFSLVYVLASFGLSEFVSRQVILVSSLAMAAGALVTHFLGATVDRVRVFTTIFFIQGVAHGSIALVAAWSPALAIFLFTFASFLTQVGVTTLWSMLSDSVDYGQHKTGVRNNGLIFSSFLFALKLGGSAAGVIGSLVLSWTGYVAKQAQTETALMGILWCFAIIPAICYILVGIAGLKLKLTESFVRDVQTAVLQKRAEDAAPAAST
jgi:GPH family glycoside/pentoside/hexuronide:cation symporter